MPLDPTISLGVKPPAAPTNPMELLGSIGEVQKKLTEARFIQAKFKAQQQAGTIIAAAPSLADGIAAINKVPEIAMFPEIANSVAEGRDSLLAWQGNVSKQANDTTGKFLDSMAGAVVHKDYAKASADALVSTIMSPEVRKAAMASIDRWNTYTNDGLSGDPAKDEQERLQRISAVGVGAGAMDTIAKLHGTSSLIDRGPGVQSAVTSPTIPTRLGGTPGQTNFIGSLMPKDLPPSVTDPRGMPVNTGRLTGGGNALSPTPAASAGANPLAMPSPKAAKSAESVTGNEFSAEDAGDGTPLYPKGYKIPAVKEPKNMSGGPANPQSEQRSTDLMKKFTDSKAMEHGQAALGNLAEMDANFDTMQKEGGFLTPGAGGEQRLAIGKIINATSAVFGGGPVFAPTALAAGEDAMKDTQRMVGSLVNQMYGNQREAAETIKNATSAVPTINNTYLGGKLVTALLRAATQRSMAEWKFNNEWAAKHHDDLRGAEAEFARLHPMSNYTDPVLKGFGMTQNGFESAKMLREQMNKGLLTPEQAMQIAKEKKLKLED